jgi:hypothetical protein
MHARVRMHARVGMHACMLVSGCMLVLGNSHWVPLRVDGHELELPLRHCALVYLHFHGVSRDQSIHAHRLVLPYAVASAKDQIACECASDGVRAHFGRTNKYERTMPRG